MLSKASGANSDRGHRGPAELTPEALVRRGRAEFLPSFAALQEAVGRACAGETEWEARVIAGCRAVLDFAAADADAAGALTIHARERASDRIDPEREVLDYFARLLADSVPVRMLFPISSEESLVESVALIVRAHLQARTADRLPQLGPDLAYLLLMPYKGLEGARAWAGRPSRPPASF